ncbi:MAG: alpha/beta hydrolase [Erysipelotrichaceae bacterium]|nr:alpha/beta hydrolase [Erysipelotrichaceae bacterium]MBR2545796.1 hypothetical protein [Erysipelotrichaceae bacterium]
MIIGNREIDIYRNITGTKAPAVMVIGEHHDVEEIMKHIDSDNYILINIKTVNWNDDLTPWYMDRLFRSDQPYNGKADCFIREIEEIIIPELHKVLGDLVSYYAIAGYSLAGLFSVYSIYRTKVFRRLASVSGSLWYPEFVNYAEKELLCVEPEKIYFSLGDRENKSRNALMSTVKDCTVRLRDFYAERGIDTVFEENPGNHFQNAAERLAKGISWILK